MATRRSGNNTKGSVATADQTMAWSQYWSWFTSTIITDAERRETYVYFLKADPLAGMTDAGKVEVLEFAPDYIIDHQLGLGKITPEIVAQIRGGSAAPQAVAGTITALSYKELLAQVRR